MIALWFCLAPLFTAHAQTKGPTHWRFTHSLPAPWASPQSPSGDDLRGQTLELAPNALFGPGALRCGRARVERLQQAAEGLFEGGLPAPAADAARALGFAHLPSPGLRVLCDNASFDFHFVDAETLLIGLDNRVWTLSGAAGAQAAATSPAGVTQRLLELHFSGDMAFTAPNVTRKARYLSAGLRLAIAQYFAADIPKDEVPPINGDPFTNAQEYPTRFAVDSARIKGRRAEVEVRLADGWRVTQLIYRLREEKGQWRVDDIVDETGGSFVQLLKGP